MITDDANGHHMKLSWTLLRLLHRYKTGVQLLEGEPVCREMQACRDEIVSVMTFAATHRPEERRRLSRAQAHLKQLQAEHPHHWAALCYLVR